jgi:hypothetical protein
MSNAHSQQQLLAVRLFLLDVYVADVDQLTATPHFVPQAVEDCLPMAVRLC